MRLAQSPYQLYLGRLRKEASQRRKERSPFRDPETDEIPFYGLADELRELGLV